MSQLSNDFFNVFPDVFDDVRIWSDWVEFQDYFQSLKVLLIPVQTFFYFLEEESDVFLHGREFDEVLINFERLLIFLIQKL